MIKNIPDPKDYYHASLNYMNISWNMAFEVFEISKEVVEDDGDTGYRMEQRYHLNTSLMLLSQAIELFIKFRIAEVNPLLMVNLKAGGTDSDFNDLTSIDAKDLLKLHDQIRDESLGPSLKTIFEEIREKRNKVMHSAGTELHAEEEIIGDIIKLSSQLYKQPWLKWRIQYLSNSYFTDAYVNTYQATKELSICMNHLTVGDFRIYSGHLPKVIFLRCNDCIRNMEGDLDDFTCIKLGELNYKCLICESEGQLKNSECSECNNISVDVSSEECLHCDS